MTWSCVFGGRDVPKYVHEHFGYHLDVARARDRADGVTKKKIDSVKSVIT